MKKKLSSKLVLFVIASVVAITILPISPRDAYATGYTISDQTSCLSLPFGSPSWNSFASQCTLANINLTLNPLETLTVSGSTLVLNGGTITTVFGPSLTESGRIQVNSGGDIDLDSATINNNGIIDIYGSIQNEGGTINNNAGAFMGVELPGGSGVLRNSGTIINNGEIDIAHTLYLVNFGTFTNYGSIGNIGNLYNNGGTFINSAGATIINNLGTITNDHGTFTNAGTITSTGRVDIPGTINIIAGNTNNSGTINSGEFQADPTDPSDGTAPNSAIISGSGTISNTGSINNCLGEITIASISGIRAENTCGPTTTLVTSDVNPSSIDQNVIVTITVKPNWAVNPVPTGGIVLSDGSTTIADGSLNASGKISFTIQPHGLILGLNALSADYEGDANFKASSSDIYYQTVLKQTATTTTLTSSLNPAVFGQSVTFTATVAPSSGTGMPTGTVAFNDGTTTLATVALDSGGHATFTTSSLATSTHAIIAVYGGDSNFLTSTSPSLTQTINPANQPPVANTDSYSTNENTVLTVPHTTGVLANDNDPDGDILTSSLVTGTSHGTVVLNPDGSFAYTPNSDFVGSDSFVYQTDDGHGHTASATDTISVNQIECPAGSFLSSGANTCTLAPPGSYVPSPGATSATLCPAGTFTATEGQSVCTPSPPGSYVPSPGATSATLCAPGSYQPESGQTSCILADIGYFVSSSGATQETQCPAGTTSDVTGSTICRPLTPTELTHNLITLKEDMHLQQGITESLDAKLNSVLSSLNSNQNNAAKNQLNAFINEVNAQTGKKITQDQATQLIQAAQNIINSIH